MAKVDKTNRATRSCWYFALAMHLLPWWQDTDRLGRASSMKTKQSEATPTSNLGSGETGQNSLINEQNRAVYTLGCTWAAGNV